MIHSPDTKQPLPWIADDCWPAVAHHEAGHAVAYVVGSRAVYGNDGWFKVSIRPGAIGPYVMPRGGLSDCAGIVESPGFHNVAIPPEWLVPFRDERQRLFQRSLAIQQVIFALAGPFAEAAYLGDRDPWEMAEAAFGANGFSSDYENAESAFEALRYFTPRRPRWDTLAYRTAQLVLDHWTAIEAMAARLLVKHELDHDEALAIVVPHLPATPPATSAALPA
ncbi:hypothetical protein [Mesorhizobium sp.]|uniref:hypothetical protein n=1 Tax=Mesorhizobium sp. TaxID=1871066 RepID=UPI000FE752B3|nr:hypothetical protein [Mesorhizobium sp.]RWO46319.1 MAG: hypothetical protein EOS13_26820 [Mesorhizobium sp.]